VCETFPQELPLVSLHYTAAFLKSKKRNEQRIAKQLNANNINDMDLDSWFQLVWMYTYKNLSVPGDKLVALSGVAKYVMSHVRDVYVAGMWRRNLERALLWTQDTPGSRPLEYRAPSWSWASVDGVICHYITIRAQSLIHVEDVVLNYATEDYTGAVTGGWLDLRGSLKPMRLQEIERNGSTVWHMTVDNSIVSQRYANTTHGDIGVSLDIGAEEVSTFDYDNVEERLFFMPSFDLKEHYSLQCLMFRLASPESTTFERIGLVEAHTEQGRDMLLAELDEETKAHLPCLRYENGVHTIRII
jgi:hypothetical protein